MFKVIDRFWKIALLLVKEGEIVFGEEIGRILREGLLVGALGLFQPSLSFTERSYIVMNDGEIWTEPEGLLVKIKCPLQVSRFLPLKTAIPE